MGVVVKVQERRVNAENGSSKVEESWNSFQHVRRSNPDNLKRKQELGLWRGEHFALCALSFLVIAKKKKIA